MHIYQDIPRIYTGIAEMLACFIYCMILPQKSSLVRRLWHLAVGILIQCSFLYVTRSVPLYLWIGCMLIAFVMMYLFLDWNCRLDRISLIYITIRAIILAEFAASAEWECYIQVRNVIGEGRASSVLLMLFMYALIFGGVYLLERHYMGRKRKMVYSWSDVFAASLIGIATFAVSNLGFLLKRPPFGMAQVDIFNTRTLVDLGGMAILYAFEFRIGELQAEKDLANLSLVLQSQYENYRNYQETIELINIKYHDLKHHTMLLRQETDPERREAHLEELERELTQFRPEQRTGNYVLDTILSGKSMKMKNSQIQFTCMADGKLLDFMHVTDICTIFGNALDNAIEHVAQIEDPEKRLISMSVGQRRGFLYIEISNYCEGTVEMEDGLPVTTKKDRELHGYGVRSLVYAVHKYGGEVSFEEKNHFFEVRMIIPLEQAT